MRIQDLFTRRRPPSPPAPSRPTCPCGTPGHRPIRGDGPTVCPVRVYGLGDAAARPGVLDESILEYLALAHGDRVRLVETRVPGGRVLAWLWTDDEHGALA